MLRLEILLSCMNLDGRELVQRSKIESDTVVVNQCDKDDFAQYSCGGKNIKIYSVNDRGLTKSRNFAIAHSQADICLLCDDDETFKKGYEKKIIRAYERISDADVIIFNIGNRPASFKGNVKRLNYFDLMKVSSWQISFRRKSLLKYGMSFDEHMGAGSGNGAEEEFKLLTDCRKAGMKIYFCRATIADVAQTQSTWFKGFDKEFFVNRGNTTRYIMGLFPSLAYALYYCVRKQKMFGSDMSCLKALKYTCQGIFENRLVKLKRKENG